MKNSFMLAITQLSAEKHLPKDVVLSAVESALVSAYKKGNIFSPSQNIVVKINPATGDVKVYIRKMVAVEVVDPENEISLDDARIMNNIASIGETVDIECTPTNAGRIAAQTARQVILQRLHEAEHNAVYEEYSGKEGDVVAATVQRMEPRQVLLDISRAEAVLPTSEQVRGERYRVGQRMRVYVLEVARSSRGPQVVVSRAHRNFLRRLFELEIPEIASDAVEIKSVAREAGQRSKVAVAARQEGVDPVGCCVGLRGIRIQSIVNELNGERIDVCQWSSDPASFITNALSPAQITSVELNESEQTAMVIVPDRQLSLAIGREGQNARLAARLTGWRIDIKSATAAEVQKVEDLALTQEYPIPSEAEEVPQIVSDVEEVILAQTEVVQEEETREAIEVEVAGEIVEPLTEVVEVPEEEPLIDEAQVAPEIETTEEEVPLEVAIFSGGFFSPTISESSDGGQQQIRFAEDILGTRPGKSKKKRKGKDKGGDNRGKKTKKIREGGADMGNTAGEYAET